MNRIMWVIALWNWLESRGIHYLNWSERIPLFSMFANVVLCAYREESLIARTSYHNGSVYAVNAYHSLWLAQSDNGGKILKMQAQKALPLLAMIRLFNHSVPWVDNRAWIDGFVLRREQKTAKSGNVYTVGYYFDGIRYERLGDCLKRLEQLYYYNRGNWHIAKP